VEWWLEEDVVSEVDSEEDVVSEGPSIRDAGEDPLMRDVGVRDTVVVTGTVTVTPNTWDVEARETFPCIVC
jgi:hypothetical protein